MSLAKQCNERTDAKRAKQAKRREFWETFLGGFISGVGLTLILCLTVLRWGAL